MKVKPKTVAGVNIKYRLFPETRRPAFADTLRFPSDVTALAAVNVSDLHGKYTELYAFANQELCRINVEILALQTKQSQRKNAMFRHRPGMNGQERWRRDAIIDCDPEMERLESALAKKKQEREYTSMYLQNFDRYLTALSRELSRKMHEQGLK